VRLEQHPAVEGVDLEVIYEYISRENPVAAESVIDAVRATILQLVAQPRSGVSYPTGIRRLAGLRMLPAHHFRNYLIFHVVGSDFVRILYVMHASRNLPEVFAVDVRE
jgi:plasmid stabilization system protein ParE